MTGPAASELAEPLTRALSEHFSAAAELTAVRPLSGGASREILAVEATVGGAERRFVLRRDPGERSESSREEEFDLVAAAHRHGVPVPEPFFALDPGAGVGSGFLMERVDGETVGPRILRSEELAGARAGLAAECGAALARIHAIPLEEVEFLGGDREGPALAQLDEWQGILDGIGEPHPVLELALRRLRARLPEAAAVGVVHGDFRNGNLIVGPEGLRAVLDWELAHAGDPMEDLGWVCVRAWRFGRPDLPVGGFGTREQLFAAYEEVSGSAVDPEAVRFWELFGNLKWAVICLMQAQAHLSGAQRSMELAAIGRRACEPEWELLEMLEGAA
ncbi:MAG: phosphotransferase family protein [Solirubrobacterales bacterium]